MENMQYSGVSKLIKCSQLGFNKYPFWDLISIQLILLNVSQGSEYVSIVDKLCKAS